jgi:hypothetical protein
MRHNDSYKQQILDRHLLWFKGQFALPGIQTGLGEEAVTAFAQLGNLKKMGEQPHPLASDVVGRRGWNGDDTVERLAV